ncbi:MAG: protein-glutamate O-methyltransferase CheR [Desulfobacteraceae bacterium]|nr:protein-glutamate O-methyltransferase CheR [Desulfobacteraceae bacterium]
MNNEDIEIMALLKAVRLKYGYDFSQYAGASLTRRIKKCLADSGLKYISEMIPLILYRKAFFDTFLNNFTVNVTEMFRDPLFFLSLRKKVVPYLHTYPFIKVWSVGVSTGEEVYSLAILLKEEGLYEKCLIYATDFNDTVLETARKGIYPAENIKKSTQNYQKAGGVNSFGTYYHADYNSVIFDRSIKKNIVFANHNLAIDSVFGEMNLILCRNVLIYFNRDLQERVLRLFDESLCNNGFLSLGSKETLNFSTIADYYTPVVKKHRIYQKK